MKNIRKFVESRLLKESNWSSINDIDSIAGHPNNWKSGVHFYNGPSTSSIAGILVTGISKLTKMLNDSKGVVTDEILQYVLNNAVVKTSSDQQFIDYLKNVNKNHWTLNKNRSSGGRWFV